MPKVGGEDAPLPHLCLHLGEGGEAWPTEQVSGEEQDSRQGVVLVTCYWCGQLADN